jgi:DNA-binding SARP family transcriptional activator/tetratricopeptide (TPR) repeat protein
MTVEFRLLGRVEARLSGRLLDIGHARQRCVLAALLIEANRVVSIDQLIDCVWGDRRLPSSPLSALQTYISLLRRAIAPATAVTIARQSAGYQVSVDEQAVDAHRFRGLVRQARAADDDHGAVLLEEALGLWHGEPLAGLDTPWAAATRVTLTQDRRSAQVDLVDLHLRRGGHASVLSVLSGLAAEHPLDERVARQLMVALYRSGRQADALAQYRRIRERLAEELGVDPDLQLQRLHQRILTADPTLSLAGPAPGRESAAGPGSPPLRPLPQRAALAVARQLPADVPEFTGRARDLAELDRLAVLAAPGPPSGAPAARRPGIVIAAVSGTAGVGKTALALRWAHQVADQFPDGQLYVNLHGFGPGDTPVPPSAAIRRFLDGLGIPPGRIPADLDAQAALYRSLLAGHRMLIVLDNARDPAQVRPLLPGQPGCLVLVTSRNQLTGLVAADGAHLLPLDVVTAAEGRELFRRRLGPGRAATQAQPVAEIAELCARLPLALTIAAARAAARPALPLAALAAELRRAGTRLDGLATGDPATDVRTVFSWSCRQLSAPAARMFRLLGVHPGPDITGAAAASLAGVEPGTAAQALAELAAAHLVTEHAPGRYGAHDLLRAYAADQARSQDGAASSHAARARVLDHYLRTAVTASLLLHSRREPITLAPAQPGVRPEALASSQDALAWFRAERPVLLAAVSQAAASGFHAHAWQLAWATAQFLSWQGYWHDQAATQEIALAAARQDGDLAGQAQAHRFLGQAQVRLGAYAAATGHLGRALELGQQLGSQSLQALLHIYLCRALLLQGQPRDALGHAEESVRIYREARHRWGAANALNTVGWCQAHLGAYAEALESCQGALAELRELGDRPGEAATLDSLGYAHHHLAHYGQAIACYEQAIEAHREVGDLHLLAETLTHLGDTQAAAGAPAAARRAWQQAVSILDDMSAPGAAEVRERLAGPLAAP